MRFEHRKDPLLSAPRFYRRMLTYAGFSVGLVLPSLGIGVLGYHYFGGLAWLDALLNASMLLGGMGPVNPIETTAGKLFASFFALFSGTVLLVAVGVLITPIFHRLLHQFHLESPDDKDADEPD